MSELKENQKLCRKCEKVKPLEGGFYKNINIIQQIIFTIIIYPI